MRRLKIICPRRVSRGGVVGDGFEEEIAGVVVVVVISSSAAELRRRL